MLSKVSDFLVLCKIKVVALILLTALVGMLLSQSTIPNIWLILISLIGIGLTASSAAVFNHIIDKKIDVKMARTNKRPLVKGTISDRSALIFGITIGLCGVVLLWFFVNFLTALLTFTSLVGYAIIYTIYLKHKTPQNIVIGGIAGAMPPVIGWSAITNTIDPNSLLLFIIIFVWTPPHFWALAIHRYEDYKQAKVPMLPITHGIEFTKTQIILYTILLVLSTILPYLTGMSGIIYLVPCIILGVIFINYSLQLKKQPENKKLAMNTFSYSVNYLIILFVFLMLDHYLANYILL